jgi:hypothetical protein
MAMGNKDLIKGKLVPVRGTTLNIIIEDPNNEPKLKPLMEKLRQVIVEHQHLPEFRDIRCVVKHKAPKPGEEVIINEKIKDKKITG